jgi:hypothetical protein
MNLNNNPTPEQLRTLIRQGDDSAGHHVLWVKRTGEVELSRLPKDGSPVAFEKEHPDMQLRSEAFLAGNEYVGPDAADDDQWVHDLFDNLLKQWPQAKGKPEVAHIERF